MGDSSSIAWKRAVLRRTVITVSLIGTLEQIGLVNLLQRLESYSKSGLLIVKQDAQWVELYFRDGCLMCIGPVRSNATLGIRLLQEGFISPRALQETLLAIGGGEPGEMQLALTLIDRKHISQEQLRNWAMKKAFEVFQALLFWGNGEIYFEENVAPPADRLLVAVAVSTLLPSLTAAPTPTPPSMETFVPTPASPAYPVHTDQLSNSGPLQPRLTRASEIPNVPTLTSPLQFGLEASAPLPTPPAHPAKPRQVVPPPTAAAPMNNAHFSEAAAAPPSTGNLGNSYVSVFEQPPAASNNGGSFFGGDDDSAFVSFLDDDSNSGGNAFGSNSGRRQPEPVTAPFAPKRIDISFMRPEMLLLPVDFSPALMQNPSVQVTPEQWMIFAQVDGQTSLQRICMNLGTQPTQVCQVVGELIAEGLIQLCMPDGAPVQEPSSRMRDTMTSGLSNGYITPGYASMPVPSWPPTTPAPDVAGFSNTGFEVKSQRGNGTGFTSGRSRAVPPQSMQPAQTSGPLGAYPNMYAPVGRS
ncbi:MAG TPA: DUF4388 domain-containing protein [Ktedonobacteraceae bacterium]|nr:DUF4388 domain-containing protein [Ktedonobacteraceae bacterium]